MIWLLPRLAITAFFLLLGGFGGYFATKNGVPWMGALLGGSIALCGIAVRDTLNGYRLIAWLRSSHRAPAPRDAGLWGELGYRAERAIRQSEMEAQRQSERLTQFISAMEATPNGIMLLDRNDQIEWCNSLAADHFGLDPQRDRRQRVTNLVRAPAFVEYLQAAKFTEAVRIIDPQGRRALSVLIQPYGEGQRLVISRDVTESELTDGMRRDFVANVSHEIRTPLTVLAGFIETMTNLPLPEKEKSRVLQLMKQQTDRMATLVADLLTLAQLEGSPRPNADRWVALKPLFEQAAVEARQLSDGKHSLVFADPESAQVAGAATELLSAITNLLSNAVRYTPANGRIELAWRVLGDGMGEISVSDTGLGIAREHLPRLTERFYRVDGSRSRDTGGTGLGLSIVKHVAKRHGGELDVQSEVNKGSNFRLLFPAARVRASFTEPSAGHALSESVLPTPQP